MDLTDLHQKQSKKKAHITNCGRVLLFAQQPFDFWPITILSVHINIHRWHRDMIQCVRDDSNETKILVSETKDECPTKKGPYWKVTYLYA